VYNYNFFVEKIDDFLQNYASYFPYFPTRILDNCILLPIEAESQNTALRIFSTLNDRGLPLADADIFKAQLYKYYGDKDEKDDFMTHWKDLEEIAGSISYFDGGAPMDELFARYMYFLRAKEGNKRTTTEALRKFYEKNKYSHLMNDAIVQNMKSLALFWRSISHQQPGQFSESLLKKLFVLTNAPNEMWQNIVFRVSRLSAENPASPDHIA